MQEISFCNLGRQYESIREEILEVTDQVFRSGVMLGGEQTTKFEKTMAEYCNRQFALVCSSGTQALEAAYRGLKNLHGVKRAVIPGFSYVATRTSVEVADLEPVYRDVTDEGLLDVRTMMGSTQLNSETCVNYVNLGGNVLDYSLMHMVTEFFSQDKIFVIEDAAQSLGSTRAGRPSGSFGDISTLSFDPMKILPNYNNGGMLLVDDAELYLMLKAQVRLTMYSSSSTKSTMSEADCAQMLVKFSHFPRWMERRRQIAQYYLENITNPHVGLPKYDTEVSPNWGRFTIRAKGYTPRHLRLCGVEAKIHYPYTLNQDASLVNSKKLVGNCVSLPIYPEMTDAEVEHVVKSVNELRQL